MKLIASDEAQEALSEQMIDGDSPRAITYNMAVSSCKLALSKVHEYDVGNPTEPQAQWIIKQYKGFKNAYYVMCSRCGSKITISKIGKRRYNYCPFCGAVMSTTAKERGTL